VLAVVPDPAGRDSPAPASLIDEIVREGARRMLAEALQAEVGAYVAQLAGERDENGRRRVVRNGCHQSREVLTSAGAVQVTVPRVNDKRTGAQTGERKRLASAILPPRARKTRRSPGCCRCCTCTACPRVTSCPRSASSPAHPLACRRR
jgi:predicted amidohydrolase